MGGARGGGFNAAGGCQNQEEVRDLTKVPDRFQSAPKCFSSLLHPPPPTYARRGGGGGGVGVGSGVRC